VGRKTNENEQKTPLDELHQYPTSVLGKFVFLVKQSFACPIVSMRIYIGRFDRWDEIA
jgi:hypothetical protein